MALLEVKNLSITFDTKKGPITPVRDISFVIEKGQSLGVVGESGCGKSLTNLALMGLLPDNATVKAEKMSFDGNDLKSLSNNEWQKIRGNRMSMIFQDPMTSLNPSFTVGYQIEETLKLHRSELNKVQRKKRLLELFDMVGIPDPARRLSQYPHEMSGGMNQRVMIAMSMACDPELLIADEPTTALDVTIQDQILNLLLDLQKQTGMALILVTHDLGVVAQNTSKLQVMYAGEIVETGDTQSLIHSPRHPYTRGLLNSHAGHGHPFRSPLPSISGLVPDLFHRPKGCQFKPRCDIAVKECELEQPQMIDCVRCLKVTGSLGGQQ
ncbi:MAG: peptide ABC transporter ATP-binding protein [Bdellovibrio sp. CG12_big_fil_rev_8_21_14_0_65_39_13]|nr:MAG: peptide ABC transporter ATP-binding protein [Bdellovibrio sp. CG22_combo_CG10-13_8_21_14_all_39_27]PIQ61755.1 MAG: peptide ABC transporter ATP-binding protein [Bdellovibrio sp. CG12_big_fil_rev_8_21_14_0_65_39_13]PIR34903.1 MAG: peptide ABC transporter ATP-binding protein [Bdellovibrio sp. CG11_big_fil_rev_8_21_14_0_20_39_38]PJB53550.1 MAG: peptide ABC transporter ATP-binding protein [Bdellovibrio sp. CG_4_9_14_3_um_filter_39_7]